LGPTAGEDLAVVDQADLILLKLFAGGPQGRLDVRLLLAAADDDLPREIERRLPDVPPEIGRVWRRVRRKR
jgi:hypothetical protein